MKLLIFLLLFTKANDNVTMGISHSNIPNDCKLLYLAMTIKESGWHKNKKAVKCNNYAGFKRNNRLIKFNSTYHFIEFSEKWFIRSNIKTEKDLIRLLKSGKYANQNKKGLEIYVKSLLQIKKSIKQYYNNLDSETII